MNLHVIFLMSCVAGIWIVLVGDCGNIICNEGQLNYSVML